MKNKILLLLKWFIGDKMELNREKMKQVIHYIVDKCQEKPSFGKTVLYKIMYFSDFNYYEIYETLITDETYIKKQNGPIPSHFDDCCNELKNERKVNNEVVLVIDYPRIRHFSLEDPDTSLLNNEELEVIDNVINELSHMNAREISDHSHGDKPWRVAEYLEPLNPEFVFYRNNKYSVREYNE